MSGPMTIEQVSWQRGGSSGAETGTYNSFKLYMGVAASSNLTDTFETNYVAGTRTQIYATGSQTMQAGADEWMTITLDTPYVYNGTDNLIFELEWVGGANMFYTYMWDTGANRGLMNKTDITSPTGTLSTSMSELMFTGSSSLEAVTLGFIKALLGN
jgi:hypothetical protein